ncbi:MAG: hypothetical protein ACTHJQ_09060 [Rhizobiaceae bacterium]|jgi:hypothetical protein
MIKYLVAASAVALLCSPASADQFVRGYTTHSGTYVAPHYRSSPDSSYNNNWSVKPNYNPYTGQSGYRNPTYNDRTPTYGTYGGSSYGSHYGTRSRCSGLYC